MQIRNYTTLIMWLMKIEDSVRQLPFRSQLDASHNASVN